MLFLTTAVSSIALTGLSGCEGYKQGWLYPENITSVYVEMFDSKSFRRDYEYLLTDAICKQIEVQTPYKVIADETVADTKLYGYIASMNNPILATDRESGKPVEQEAVVRVVFSWKNLSTGQMYADNVEVVGACSYSEFQGQGYQYAAEVAVNKAAQKILESMQTEW